MKVFLAETDTTRLQLQFQQSFLNYIPCYDATVMELIQNWDNQYQQAKQLSNEV